MEVAHGYLLVRDVPYVNAERDVKSGTLVFQLNLTADVAETPADHTAYFIGETPCDANGTRLTKILNHSHQTQLGPGIVANHYFSAKPRSGNYADYYEKITAYINMLAGHAVAIDPEAKAKVFRPFRDEDEDSPFVYGDTASSRAGIVVAASQLAGQRIAIVGLGGTGAYVLDLVAKTPVAEIHLYDGDWLHQHNAFRYPGAVAFEVLEARPYKVDFLTAEYRRLHRGVRAHPVMIVEDNVVELSGYDVVFVCVDSNKTRGLIANAFAQSSTVMFDTGMGVKLTDTSELYAIVRLSIIDAASADQAIKSIPIATEDPDNLYGTNAQVGDLNCLNAYLAVEAWKKRFGFYFGRDRPYLITYTTASGLIAANEDES